MLRSLKDLERYDVSASDGDLGRVANFLIDGYIGLWGQGPSPGLLAAGAEMETPVPHSDKPNDVHLRSANELHRYQVHASDGQMGHVDDFIVDDETWEVRYVVVQTSHLWFGKRVLVATRWANRISWEGEAIYVDLTRETVKACPAWDASAPINREYEVRLYDYYGRPTYWNAMQEPSPRDVLPRE